MTGYRAARLPHLPGPAAWNAILEPQAPPLRLEQSRTADFVVIGAGFAGLSAARRLTQLVPGSDIAVVDAGQIAEGSAGRNSGFMIDLPHELTSDDYAGAGDDRTIIELNRQAIDFGTDAVGDYGIRADYFDRAGKINGAASPAAHRNNETYGKHLNNAGEPSEMLDQKQMREITGSSHYLSGLYTPGTIMLQPAGYVRGLASGLAKSGVSICENSPVTAIETSGSGWRVVTKGGSISTERVILCVNGHLESFGIERGHLMQVFLFATMTPELDSEQIERLGGQARWGITPSDPMGTTMRRIDTGQGGNRIITRTCAVLRPGMRPKEPDLRRAKQVMRTKFDARFPQLAGLKMQYSWAGHLCLSRNGVSVMREIDKGIYSACVQNGLGTARGTLTGIGAAELACGAESEITRFFGGESRPNKLPPQPLQQWGANSIIRWKEWRARSE